MYATPCLGRLDQPGIGSAGTLNQHITAALHCSRLIFPHAKSESQYSIPFFFFFFSTLPFYFLFSLSFFLPALEQATYSATPSEAMASELFPKRSFGTFVKTSKEPVPIVPSRPRTIRAEGVARLSQSPSRTASFRKFRVVCGIPCQ